MTATMTNEITLITLPAETAADLMTPNPMSIREDLSLREAIAFFVDRNISGAAVIDDAGRPMGVLTQSDILVHDREEIAYVTPEYESGEPLPKEYWDEFQFEQVPNATRVRDVMTPAVFCVGTDTPAWTVVRQMRELNVHRLFVVDGDGVLVGVITAMDLVRQLAPE